MINSLKSKFAFIGIILLSILVTSCKDNKEAEKEEKETIIKGSTTIVVDETFGPIIEDQLAVFQNEYDAKITLVNKPEAEAVRLLLNDSLKIAILSRKLTESESQVFQSKKITPRITPFATDAIALIVNERVIDSVIDLAEVIRFMQGKGSKSITKLVFDNANSSTYSYMNEIAGTSREKPAEGIYSFKTNDDVIQYIFNNKDAIGVVGVNWILQPSTVSTDIVKDIKVLGIKNIKGKTGDDNYYKPSQTNIANGFYPLKRELYLLNYQGTIGLGMGFASFIAGDRGQRIILKSGLYPVRTPGREILIRTEIENKKKTK